MAELETLAARTGWLACQVLTLRARALVDGDVDVARIYLSRVYAKTGCASRLELIRAVDTRAVRVGGPVTGSARRLPGQAGTVSAP